MGKRLSGDGPFAFKLVDRLICPAIGPDKEIL